VEARAGARCLILRSMCEPASHMSRRRRSRPMQSASRTVTIAQCATATHSDADARLSQSMSQCRSVAARPSSNLTDRCEQQRHARTAHDREPAWLRRWREASGGMCILGRWAFANSAAQEGCGVPSANDRVPATVPNVPSVPTESTFYLSVAINRSSGFSQGARNGWNAWIAEERLKTGQNVVGFCSEHMESNRSHE
jgi:hypothetical protein